MMRRAAPLFALLAFAGFLSACDSGSDSSSTTLPPATTPETTAPAAVPPAPDCGDPVASFAPDTFRPFPAEMPAGSYMADIKARGALRAAVAADTLLFGFRDPITGELQGFDIEMVKEVAGAIFGDRNKVEFKVVTYAQRIPSLKDASVDIVADVMTINCDRWAQINFSSQYLDAAQRILVASSYPKETEIEDLFGKKMCVAKGSTNFEELEEKYPEIVAVGVDDISDCMVLFQQGAVDAVTGDDTVLGGFVAQDPYAQIVGRALTSEPYGLGIARILADPTSDPDGAKHIEFTRFVNGVLERMRADGTWKRLYEETMKATAPEPPPALYGRAL